MDDIFQEIEASLSRIGSQVIWKRDIGGRLMWLSPITHTGQQRVVAAINDSEAAGANIVHDMKRLTLSFSIVGIDGLDLTKYRTNDPMLPFTGRDGRQVLVTLDKFIYEKMSQWSAQFVDDLFSVYADLLESHGKENLSKIKFDNVKSPEDELRELESKAAGIRAQLGKPQLIEPQTATAPKEAAFDAFRPVE
jgi:hypothetical protein